MAKSKKQKSKISCTFDAMRVSDLGYHRMTTTGGFFNARKHKQYWYYKADIWRLDTDLGLYTVDTYDKITPEPTMVQDVRNMLQQWVDEQSDCRNIAKMIVYAELVPKEEAAKRVAMFNQHNMRLLGSRQERGL